MKKIIFFITIFIMSLSIVSAEELLEVDHIYDTYTYFYDQEQGKNRYLYAEKYSFNNNLAYCLEIGKKIENRSYSFTTSFDSLNLPLETIEKIKLIAYYGYQYPNHNTDKYFMATQELI